MKLLLTVVGLCGIPILANAQIAQNSNWRQAERSKQYESRLERLEANQERILAYLEREQMLKKYNFEMPEVPDISVPDQQLKVTLSTGSTGVVDAAGVPTAMPIVHRALAFLYLKPEDLLEDAGCGADARVLITAAQIYGCDGIGIEIDHDRAESAKKAVKEAGLTHKIQIIEGDATKIRTKANKGYAYLWPDVLEQMTDKIKKFDRFVSYSHPIPKIQNHEYGDLFMWISDRSDSVRQVKVETKPVVKEVRRQQKIGVMYGSKIYYGPKCNSTGCGMCNQIRTALARTPPNNRDGYWKLQKYCNGRRCWYDYTWVNTD